MSQLQLVPITCFASFLLTACGSSSGSGSSAPENLYFGSTDPVTSGNRLPYADGDSTALDGNANVLMARYVTVNDTGASHIELSRESIALTGFDLETDKFSEFTGTLRFAGENVSFVNGTGTLSNGVDVGIYTNAGAGDSTKTEARYSAIVGIDAGRFEDDQVTFGTFAVGRETEPEVVDVATGHATYSGDYRGRAAVIFPEGGAESTGTMNGRATLHVNFNDSLVSGNITAKHDFLEAGFSLDFEGAEIRGNGFSAGGLTNTNCAAEVTCSSNSHVGGVFFGPNGEEISGIASIDYTERDSNGDGFQIVGVGGFTATPETE